MRLRKRDYLGVADLDATLTQYLTTYNHHIPQRALNHQSPIQALKRWKTDKPDLFIKRTYKQAGLDSPSTSRQRFWSPHFAPG